MSLDRIYGLVILVALLFVEVVILVKAREAPDRLRLWYHGSLIDVPVVSMAGCMDRSLSVRDVIGTIHVQVNGSSKPVRILTRECKDIRSGAYITVLHLHELDYAMRPGLIHVVEEWLVIASAICWTFLTVVMLRKATKNGLGHLF